MNYISDALYWISTGLLVPVIILLILLFARSLLLIGSFFGQYITIRKTEALLHNAFAQLNTDNVAQLVEQLPQKATPKVITSIKQIVQHRQSKATQQHLLNDFELAANKDLAVSKTLTKMGPMLGLMGTLIPMGPALVGLANGDIASMAYNMQVAFATTVVGLFASAVGFITGQIKQRWFLQDVANLEYLIETLNEKHDDHEA